MVPKTLQSDRIASDVPGYVHKQEEGGHQVRTDNYTDQTEYLHTVTADGSAVILDAMVFWFIVDTEMAAKTAMKILDIGASQNINANDAIGMASKNIVDLKLLVLRIAKLHLTAAVGACSLAGKSALSKKIDKNKV